MYHARGLWATDENTSKQLNAALQVGLYTAYVCYSNLQESSAYEY